MNERTTNLEMKNEQLRAEIAQRKEVEQTREKLYPRTAGPLLKIKTLSALLPVCFVCKKIRDDRGY